MIKKLISKSLFLLLFIASFNAGTTNIGYARWATLQDCDFKTEYLNQNIYIHKDGKNAATLDMQIQLLNEEAKSSFTPYTFTYDAQCNKTKILEAKTIINNQAYPVHPSQIIDHSVASAEKHLNSERQISITYPNLKKGASIYLKYQQKNISPIKKHYYSSFFFGNDQYAKSSQISIRSEIPLYVSMHDPNDALQLKQNTIVIKNKTLYLVDIKQKKPIHTQLIDEGKGHLNPKNMSLVSVSSVPTLTEYGKLFSKDYEKIKQQALPELYKEIAYLAQQQKTPIQKINTVTSLLSEKINYLSDSRTPTHGYAPRALQEVANTRLGDCKDFSMATAVILQSMGMQANVALVLSGEMALPVPTNLPGYGYAEHAIVKVDLPSGPLWLDPTSNVSIAPYISENISNRGAIVLNGNQSSYEMIPALQAKHQQIIQNVVWDMQNPDQIKIKGTIQFLGTAAQHFAGTQNQESEQSIQSKLLNIVKKNFGCGPISEYHFSVPSLTSRIINDLSFDYRLTAQISALRTNEGMAIPLFYTTLNRFIIKKETVSDTYLGTPIIMELSATFKNIAPIGRNNLNCNIESPWVNISRIIQYKQNQVFIHQKLELKKSWIESAELQSDEYKKLQLAIEENFNNGIAIVFESPMQ